MDKIHLAIYLFLRFQKTWIQPLCSVIISKENYYVGPTTILPVLCLEPVYQPDNTNKKEEEEG